MVRLSEEEDSIHPEKPLKTGWNWRVRAKV